MWTAWSEFESITVRSDQEDGEISRSTEQPHNLGVEDYIVYVPEFWNNTWTYALGASYKLNEE